MYRSISVDILLPNEEVVPEQIVKLVEEMCNGATTRVRTECRVSAEFPVTVSRHQESARNHFLFVVEPSAKNQRKKYWSYCMQMT